jgi:hypothetical protein
MMQGSSDAWWSYKAEESNSDTTFRFYERHAQAIMLSIDLCQYLGLQEELYGGIVRSRCIVGKWVINFWFKAEVTVTVATATLPSSCSIIHFLPILHVLDEHNFLRRRNIAWISLLPLLCARRWCSVWIVAFMTCLLLLLLLLLQLLIVDGWVFRCRCR